MGKLVAAVALLLRAEHQVGAMARTEFRRRTLVAVLLVVVGLQGCSGEPGPAEPTVTAAAQTSTAEPSPSPSGSASPTADDSKAGGGSFEDDFSDPESGWHELDEPDAGSASYTDGTYVVTDVEGESPLRLPAPLEIKPGNADVQMSVTVDEFRRSPAWRVSSAGSRPTRNLPTRLP